MERLQAMELGRYYSHYKHRSTGYYNPFSSALFSEVSKLHKEINSLETALQACDTRVLFIFPTAENKYPVAESYYSINGCTVKKYLTRTGTASVVYAGKKIDVYPISLWFHVSPGPTLKDVIQAHRELQRLLDEHFQPYAVHFKDAERQKVELLATPAMLGTDLLKRTLPYDTKYETLPDKAAFTLIEHNTQGRIETFYHGNTELDNLHYYDARWFYANFYRHVACGPVQHDDIPEVMKTAEKIAKKTGKASSAYIPGFYNVDVTIPSAWAHIGLLPLREGRHMVYPREAGRTFNTWASMHEIKLATQQQWNFTVKERILWPETFNTPEPLRAWGDKLVLLRTKIALTYPEPIKGYLQDAFRGIMLTAIGSFNKYVRDYDGYAPSPEDIPDDYTDFKQLSDDLWHYTVRKELAPLQQALSQPQIPMDIWGHARGTLATAALQVPFKQLVALRSDAIWTNCSMPFEDTGKLGQFRLKPLHKTTGLEWPKDNTDMLKLVRQENAAK